MIGTAGTTTCCSSTCSCYDCRLSTDATTSGSYYRIHHSGTGDSIFYLEAYRDRGPFEFGKQLNLFDERYWDEWVTNRFKQSSPARQYRPRAIRMLFSARWVPRTRNTKPRRRKVRVFERGEKGKE